MVTRQSGETTAKGPTASYYEGSLGCCRCGPMLQYFFWVTRNHTRFKIWHSAARIDPNALMVPGDWDPISFKGSRVRRFKGIHGTGAQGQTSTKGYRLVRPYQLGNRSRQRGPVDERRTTRLAEKHEQGPLQPFAGLHTFLKVGPPYT